MKQSDKPTAKNYSAEKTMRMIELLARNRNPMRLQDIAQALGSNSSTVLRFLVSLMGCGYVAQNPATLQYYLTFKICSVANMVSEEIRLFDISQAYMKQISERFGESVCLAIEENMRVVYIGFISGPDQMLRTMQRIGSRAPMHCTGVGKLLLLDHDEGYINKLIAEKGLPSFTEKTIVSKGQLMETLQIVRKNQYAFDNEECEIGARCIAVPIRDYTQKIIAGLSVTGPIFRMTDEKIQKNLSFLIQTADKLSKLLGSNILIRSQN